MDVWTTDAHPKRTSFGIVSVFRREDIRIGSLSTRHTSQHKGWEYYFRNPEFVQSWTRMSMIAAYVRLLWFRRRRAQQASKERPSLFINHNNDANFHARNFPCITNPNPNPSPRLSQLSVQTLVDPAWPSTDGGRNIPLSLTFPSDPQRVVVFDGTSTGVSRKPPLPRLYVPSTSCVEIFRGKGVCIASLSTKKLTLF